LKGVDENVLQPMDVKIDCNRKIDMMSDLLATLDAPYDAINKSLNHVRELFHKKGRLADSNAKLDETVKLMAIHHAYVSNLMSGKIYKSLTSIDTFSIFDLNCALREAASASIFVDRNGKSLFGQQPAVAFEADETELAFELFRAAGIAISAQALATDSLDVVNEAFGHHVRDNFRSNTEDAQFMTPPEVVDFIVSIAKELIPKSSHEPIVVDPSCGVGSFLIAWHRKAEADYLKSLPPISYKVVGQDKVDRMARLAKANLVFSGFPSDEIFVGSSLEDGTPVAELDGKVNLILTNPPFGARFSSEEISNNSQRSLPCFSKSKSGTSLDSEVLFLERYLTLLDNDGVCFAVVPDGIISGKGVPALARQMISRQAELLAVIELPPVTFAQAGTRTKTAILAFRKVNNPRKKLSVFFAEAHDIGFQVSKRKGVSLKRAIGTNELTAIFSAFYNKTCITLESGGFAEWRDIEPASVPAWTPRRFRSISENADGLPDYIDFVQRPLSEMVKPRKKVKSRPYSEGALFISVLHVIGEGVLDLQSVQQYKPVTPGRPIEPGNVIISRINPRIPRILVVPDLGAPLICSSEFEVLEPNEGVSPFALAFLLQSAPAQQQIQSLTSGTSASHARVHPDAIRSVPIPWPKSETDEFDELILSYENANRSIVEGISKIVRIRSL
jgi:type I restriction-modification system DNA methylase subunit